MRTTASRKSPFFTDRLRQTWQFRYTAYFFNGVRRAVSNPWISFPLRATRLLFLGGTIFSLGASMGIAEYASDPEKKAKQLIAEAARSSGAKRMYCYDPSLTSEFASWANADFHRHAMRVHSVLPRIIAAATSLQHQELTGLRLLKNKDDIDAAVKALRRTAGSWKIVVTDSPSGHPNAFVTAVCPHTVFVNDALLRVMDPTNDELAMCLSHELAHMQLGHTLSKIETLALLNTLTIILLSFIDPTMGVWLDGLVALGGKLFSASHSRECELEADRVGLEIAAAACFDTRLGVNFMSKIAEIQGHARSGWFATHPSSDDRLEILTGLAQDIHKDSPTYKDRCLRVNRALSWFNKPKPAPKKEEETPPSPAL